jgi:transposase-like protein
MESYHGKEYVSKKRHINGIESFCNFTKRKLKKFNGGEVNFELHLKECEWKYKKSIEQMMQVLCIL